MTKAEAIKWLRKPNRYCGSECPIMSEDDCFKCYEALEMAIEALQQEPKRGEWIMHPEGKFVGFPYVHYECSECRAFVPEDTEYCPRCGARMESDGK